MSPKEVNVSSGEMSPKNQLKSVGPVTRYLVENHPKKATFLKPILPKKVQAFIEEKNNSADNSSISNHDEQSLARMRTPDDTYSSEDSRLSMPSNPIKIGDGEGVLTEI